MNRFVTIQPSGSARSIHITADIELENFHGREGVDDPKALIRGQLSRTFDAGIRQAVNTR